MILRLIFFCLGLFMSDQAQSQENTQRKILSSADFKGTPDYKEDILARIYVTVSLRHKPVSCDIPGKVKLVVETPIIISSKSWMKFNMIRTKELLQELLSHEQGHYDLNEVFAAELKKTLSERCYDKMQYKLQADSIYKSLHHKYDRLQMKYDRETNYMFHRSMQAKWKREINVMLKKARSE